MARKDWTRLGGALHQALERLHLEPLLREGRALAVWAEVVGPQVAEATRAEDVRDGVLSVAVRSSTWAFELTFHKAKILQGLNTRLGRGTLRDLRFHVGSLTTPGRGELPPEPVPSPEALADRPLSADAESAIAATVAAQPDPELRARIAAALATEQRRSEWLTEHGYRPCVRCGALHRGPAPDCPACRRDRRLREDG